MRPNRSTLAGTLVFLLLVGAAAAAVPWQHALYLVAVVLVLCSHSPHSGRSARVNPAATASFFWSASSVANSVRWLTFASLDRNKALSPPLANNLLWEIWPPTPADDKFVCRRRHKLSTQSGCGACHITPLPANSAA